MEQVASPLIPFARLNFSVSSFFWINCLLVRLPESVCTNIADHFVCRLLQLTFGLYNRPFGVSYGIRTP